jgi:hypothetical protein
MVTAVKKLDCISDVKIAAVVPIILELKNVAGYPRNPSVSVTSTRGSKRRKSEAKFVKRLPSASSDLTSVSVAGWAATPGCIVK